MPLAVEAKATANMAKRSEWNVCLSEAARNTHNPIRETMERMVFNPASNKPLIPLSIGDPTVFGNLNTPQSIVNAMKDALKSYKFNGYFNSAGEETVREFLARRLAHPNAPLTGKDVVLANGCSGALELAITVLASPGQNILVPLPGFPLYTTIAQSRGIATKNYRLLPNHGWMIDLEHMVSLIDSDTVAIVVNNPSNPCGSCWPKAHLEALLEVAGAHHVPVISDEVYAGIVFEPNVFHPLASLSRDVPILMCGGLAKQFLVPGWRMGWLAIHDRGNVLGEQVRAGIQALTQVLLGPNTVVQGALPAILQAADSSYHEHINSTLAEHARISFDMLSRVPGLTPIMPQGAMYMMVGLDIEHFPKFKDDIEFVQALISEESVFCLPGECFMYPNYIRLIITAPVDKLRIAFERMASFCERHYQTPR